MQRSANFSRCRRYRYALGRYWEANGRTVLFIGLNPSTADHRQDDPTIRRCIDFARQWGFGGLWIANLFALRSTDPRVLSRHADPVGSRNDYWLKQLASRADLIVAAWGVHGSLRDRSGRVLARLGEVHYLGLTRDGLPRHPLYLRRSCRPSPLER